MLFKPRKLLKLAGFFLFVPVLLVVLYMLAGIPGALIPRQTVGFESSDDRRYHVYLIGSALHADIAVPVQDMPEDLLEQLQQTRIPFSNPALKYLGFGWGSQAFYTTAGSYSDIGFGPTLTAVTGDSAVLRVSALPELSLVEGLMRIDLDRNQLNAVVAFIRSAVNLNSSGQLRYLPDYSIAAGDAFFAAKGHFNIFNPCNQWTGRVLSSAGIATGVWTPTTYGLYLSLWWLN